MQQKENKGGLPLQKFRPRGAQRLTDILKPDILDDETRRRIVRDVMDEFPSQRVNHEGHHPASFRDRVAGGNGDLLGAMAQRLKILEAQQQAYRMELKERSEKLALTEARYEAEKAKREEVETSMLELYNEKEELERQVREMHKFLADYGLHWVGDRDDDNNPQEGNIVISSKKATSPVSPLAAGPNGGGFDLYAGKYANETPVISRSPTPSSWQRGDTTLQQHHLSHVVASNESANVGISQLPVSMDVLVRHAEILSDHVGSKGVDSDGKHGRIKEREVVSIVIYQDGICVNGGPFRPFGWPLCDAVLNDLAEGYYPYEFKDRYPDGFPIKIIDKTSLRCTPVSGAVRKDNVHSLQQVQKNGCQPMSRSEFIRNLPTTRITAGGRIVAVRENIVSMMESGDKANDNKIETGDNNYSGNDTLRHISEAERRTEKKCKSEAANGSNDSATGGALSPRRIKGLVAVLVRFPSGQKVALNLSPDNTIGDIRKELKIALPSFKRPYDIRLSFPAITYSDDMKTLRELGLLINCTLMVQPRACAIGT